MRLAISGWRGMKYSGEHLWLFQQAMEDLIVNHNKIPTLIITGGAKGADQLGEQWAKEHNIPLLVLKPEYDKHGNKAPLVRNVDIVSGCTHLLAFPHKEGSGTQHAIREAMKRDKSIMVIHL